ncbi:DNA-binding transcriptional response regulator, NtrC family, contains REC, AAA-type ATPase, and a Fis-type DNA-binding domains [Pseudarcicella hirudinis]|uniref:DNA-binding transcriptional response regulator, NtrC family, contains REC, AAA-type ATPase, and a Fis-type DNA-binding domains n=1 Tax=Pseudarcicella hirudinis TaxID=1079859 RepID=A0A1I5QT79_9BACT|nr:sigma-54 dependent transcriptional regulator [Pseudarcicella hirudinis]SFP49442.1 DNA-binding transcriptional response regulator, NtrC family, contains REC, AAA-type ATPase, and a Fis-type DNA-binding domains [Pseudarcicella hirudinis]
MLKNAKVLVVDDDVDVLLAVKMLLRPEVKEIVTEKNPEKIPGLLSQTSFDLILLDMNFKSSLNTGNEGIFWLRKIREADKNVAVIMITAYGDIDLAVRSVKEGANDFVLKPWRNEKLLFTMEEAIERSVNNQDTKGKGQKSDNKKSSKSSKNDLNTILGESEVMQEIFYKIGKIAPTDANILIMGENGTGKGEIARMIHQKSYRSEQPFVNVDLGALTESLFESELFGHKKGAFTDAREDRAGRFEAASNGTLFLDEIGNITLPQQAKLLTVLQNREVVRVGTNNPIPIDIRLISATNSKIYEMATENRFRKDLIYRLNTIEIHLPPLRERGEDVIVLAEFFAGNYAAKYNKANLFIDEKAKEKIRKYAFPGNIRELQHCLERAAIMAESDVITARDLDFSSSIEGPKIIDVPVSLKIEEIEKNTILKAIEKHDGNITKAAKELGITRTALYRRLGKYEI